jgi:FtsP/CotA-like multicopper oxidase with cupredoxin domain
VADNGGETIGSQEEVDTTPPADVSHGEAVIGGPTEADSAPRPARLAPAERGRLRRIRLEIKHATITIAPGVRYAAWTFGGSVPGPALHVRQGDTVDFTLLNHGNIPHSMDFHAAEIAPSKYYRNLMPGDSLHYRFVARVPGAFMYHCGTAPVALHIANGMYGALVVDPAKPLPPAREFFFVQSEFYLNPKPSADGTRSLDWEKLLSLAPDHVVFNGRADQYASHPIDVKPNELLRYNDRFDDPNLPGEMMTTVTLKKVSVGTELNIVQEGVPAVIPAEACYLGWQESLMLLAKLVEPEIPDQM